MFFLFFLFDLFLCFFFFFLNFYSFYIFNSLFPLMFIQSLNLSESVLQANLTLKVPNKIAADDTFIFVFFFAFIFRRKIGLMFHVNPLLAESSHEI